MDKPAWATPWNTWSGLSIWDADGHIVAEIGLRGTEEERKAVGKYIVKAVNWYAATAPKPKGDDDVS